MTLRQCVIVALVLMLCLPAGSLAMPGDAPFEPLSPPDGATVPTDPNSILVTYTCPVYRIADPGFPLFGGPKDYGVSLSDSPALGADGRLANAIRNTGSADPSVGPNGCSAAVGAGGSSPRLTETPGTYYWQVSRICTDCPGEYETGPVRTVILRSQVQAALTAPASAYTGYPFFVTARAAGAPERTELVVERKVGSGWRPAGTATALRGEGEAVVALDRRDQELRVSLTIGNQQIVSAPRKVTVRRARRWSTRAADDGRYEGRVGSRSVRFTVRRDGRELRGFRAFVPMLCPGINPGEFTTQIGTATIGRVKIAPDGRFAAASNPRQDTAIRLRGRLRHRKVTGGRIRLSVGTCVGNASYRASRASG